jgi:tetratricopeptide (TPR) repeat protein
MGRLMAPPGFGGDLDGAIEDLEFACRKEPSAEAYFYLGEAYKKKGLTDKAKTAYGKALEMKPDYPEAAKALAEIK